MRHEYTAGAIQLQEKGKDIGRVHLSETVVRLLFSLSCGLIGASFVAKVMAKSGQFVCMSTKILRMGLKKKILRFRFYSGWFDGVLGSKATR